MARLHRRTAAAPSCGATPPLITAPLTVAAPRKTPPGAPAALRTVAEGNASPVMVPEPSGSTAEDDGPGSGGAGWSGPAVAAAAVYTRSCGCAAALTGAAKDGGAGGTANGTTEGGAW